MLSHWLTSGFNAMQLADLERINCVVDSFMKKF